MSGYHVRRGPVAKEGWRKREARGNTPRTIPGKGLFSAKGRMRGQAGEANKGNKGRGRALGSPGGALLRQGCPSVRLSVQTCLFTALTDPGQRLSTARLLPWRGRMTAAAEPLLLGRLSWGGSWNSPRTPQSASGTHCPETSKYLPSPEPTLGSSLGI